MKIKNRDTKLHAIPHFAAGSFAVHIGVHLRFGIICGPVWGSSPVWGSFAVGDHLRRCTERIMTSSNEKPITFRHTKSPFNSFI